MDEWQYGSRSTWMCGSSGSGCWRRDTRSGCEHASGSGNTTTNAIAVGAEQNAPPGTRYRGALLRR